MLLAIDIGNTNISLGVYAGEKLVAHWRLETVCSRTADEYGAAARQMFAGAEINYEKNFRCHRRFGCVVARFRFSENGGKLFRTDSYFRR